MAEIRSIVVTPEATVLDETADFVTVPLYDGELGIGGSHSPLIGRLGFGELRLRQGPKVTRLYVDGGFVQVQDNVVSVLTNRAIPAESLDAASAEKQLAEARAKSAPSAEHLAIRDRAVAQARGQLRVARRRR